MRLKSPEKTVEAVTLVPRERVQQCTAEEVEDAIQSPEMTVEAVTLVPRCTPCAIFGMSVSFRTCLCVSVQFQKVGRRL